MKYIFIFYLVIVSISCGKEKVVQLPIINHSNITEIQDVSPAYLFYDVTKPDSVELNRKNLISTTNWLVNVDKRLTLKQVIPHIKFLQEKKQNASHKNKSAKNYFTCNDTSKQNLGFIEFTNVVYHNDGNGYNVEANTDITHLLVFDENNINIITSDNKIFDTNKASLSNVIRDSLDLNSKEYLFFLGFSENLNFQDYISIKSILSEVKSENIKISNHEGISN